MKTVLPAYHRLPRNKILILAFVNGLVGAVAGLDGASSGLLRIVGVWRCRRVIMARCRYPMCHRQAAVIVRDLGLASSGVYVRLVFCVDHVVEYLRRVARAGQPCDVSLYVYEGVSAEERERLRLFLEEYGVSWGGV